MYISLYRKYRPGRFGDVVGQDGIVRILRNSLRLGKVGHALLFSGPRGCGKTTVARAILQMVQSPGKIVGGEVKINGHNILGVPERELRQRRWRELALVPQGAMNSLNPVLKIKEQVGDAILAHEKISRSLLKER
ncbi:MAG TPA: ATP-binding cassette domain-containing protein, partial [Acetomicrobium sp.]|nr:ATP-binding cassette domain-containing protein [Acetomicrobium sp.]